jgi:hypothetical protein
MLGVVLQCTQMEDLMQKPKQQYVQVKLESVLELQKEIQRLRGYDSFQEPKLKRFADGLKHASTILELPLQFV